MILNRCKTGSSGFFVTMLEYSQSSPKRKGSFHFHYYYCEDQDIIAILIDNTLRFIEALLDTRHYKKYFRRIISFNLSDIFIGGTISFPLHPFLYGEGT